MDALPQKVLYSFYPDRILTFEQVVKASKLSLPFVRNTINREFVRDGLIEEVFIDAPGNHFKLTVKGYAEVVKIHASREAMRLRIAELISSGKRVHEAAKIAACEAVETGNSPS